MKRFFNLSLVAAFMLCLTMGLSAQEEKKMPEKAKEEKQEQQKEPMQKAGEELKEAAEALEEAGEAMQEKGEEVEKQAEDKSKRLSPPVETVGTVGDANITINYGAPSARGRDIYGDLVPYGEVWRTGANEATTFETDKDLQIEGQTLPAGRYSLFTIPNEDQWTIIFNSVADQWGHYEYDESKDALRVDVSPENTDEYAETMKFDVKDGKLMLKWADVVVPVSVDSADN